MGSSIYLIVVVLYTIIVIALSSYIGYRVAERLADHTTNERKEVVSQPVAVQESGAVKQITPQEIAAAKDDTRKRIKELLS